MEQCPDAETEYIILPLIFLRLAMHAILLCFSLFSLCLHGWSTGRTVSQEAQLMLTLPDTQLQTMQHIHWAYWRWWYVLREHSQLWPGEVQPSTMTLTKTGLPKHPITDNILCWLCSGLSLPLADWLSGMVAEMEGNGCDWGWAGTLDQSGFITF